MYGVGPGLLYTSQDVFGFDEDKEKAFVILEEGGSKECIDEAIDTCPGECIHWQAKLAY